jgi:TRAP-type uncharacterized transport system substrate-binding protein
MTPRGALSVATGAGLALCLWLAGPVPGLAQPARIAFQISTGSTGGTYFPVGELIAGLPATRRAHKDVRNQGFAVHPG